MINRFYLSELVPKDDFKSFLSIEDYLFSARSSMNLGLSSMTKRIFGKELDKDLQQFIAEATNLGYEEVQYAILDALLPIIFYQIYMGSNSSDVSTSLDGNPVFNKEKLCFAS